MGDGDAAGLAMVAVGGYGRGELAPASDLDVLLLHDGHRADVAEVAEAVWYPVWDAGEKLGHAVRTSREALALAADDLDTATSLLDVRHLSGDPALTARLGADATRAWQKRGRRWLARLADAVDARHAAAGEVAFLLEPDLKAGRGGLRDVHALGWAEKARRVLLDADHAGLEAAHRVLFEVRVALHRRTGRAGDVLALQEQDGVAADLGDADADALMGRVAAAARSIAWTSDETWYRVRSSLAGPSFSLSGRPRSAAAGVVLRDGEVRLVAGADPATDPAIALRLAAAAARHDARMDRDSIARLADRTPTFPDPWPAGAADTLVDLLLAGSPAIGVIETLDQARVWERILPEWASVSSRPQRNAYHRFTVDRHLCEAAAVASTLTDRVARPDLLVLGALLHDLGKGRPGDHTDAGVELATAIGPRLGLPAADVAVLAALVRHHLLIPEVATRRDLADQSIIESVVKAVGSTEMLDLLAALTEADSRATGPAAWTRWRAGLMAELVARVRHVLGGGEAHEVAVTDFPSPAEQGLVTRGRRHVAGEGDTLTVVAPDRPGVFSRVTGVLALAALDVVGADALSDDGWALARFRVEPAQGPDIHWERVTTDVTRALDGRLAIAARLEARSGTGTQRARVAAATAAPPAVVFDDAGSDTVVEVHAPDGIGVLYRITRALADLDVDIRSARVQTLGGEVVDAFYVRDSAGQPIVDAAHRAEVTRAILHSLGQMS